MFQRSRCSRVRYDHVTLVWSRDFDTCLQFYTVGHVTGYWIETISKIIEQLEQ